MAIRKAPGFSDYTPEKQLIYEKFLGMHLTAANGIIRRYIHVPKACYLMISLMLLP